MPRKGNPIAVRLGINRSSDSSWFSDYHYGKSVYQDVNLRSYLGSIHPPQRHTFGFRLGKCLLLQFPKRTFIHFFIPRRPQLRVKQQARKADKAPWWTTFGKAEPIGCLNGESRVCERKKVDPIRLLDRAKLGYGYGLVNDIAIDDRKSMLSKFLFPNPKMTRSVQSRSKHMEVLPSLNFVVMQYFLKTKNQLHFDPVLALKHFVAAEPSRADAMGRSLEKRISSRLAYFVESLTEEAADKKRLNHLIQLDHNDVSFAGSSSNTVSLFPFFGASFFFLRDGLVVSQKLDAREQVLEQLRVKCWNLLGNEKDMELIEKFISRGGVCSVEELTKVIDLMIEIILRKRGIPYKQNSYFYEVNKMRSFLAHRTNTKTYIESVKINSVYQSASLLAQDISFQLKNRKRSFHSIFAKIVKELPPRVTGIRICFSGRLKDAAEKAQTKCYKHRKTSCNVFNQKIDYAAAEVSTRYGILGVKVWISFH